MCPREETNVKVIMNRWALRELFKQSVHVHFREIVEQAGFTSFLFQPLSWRKQLSPSIEANYTSAPADVSQEREMQTRNSTEYISYDQYYSTLLDEDVPSNQEKLQFIVGHGILRPDIR